MGRIFFCFILAASLMLVGCNKTAASSDDGKAPVKTAAKDGDGGQATDGDDDGNGKSSGNAMTANEDEQSRARREKARSSLGMK